MPTTQPCNSLHSFIYMVGHLLFIMCFRRKSNNNCCSALTTVNRVTVKTILQEKSAFVGKQKKRDPAL